MERNDVISENTNLTPDKRFSINPRRPNLILCLPQKIPSQEITTQKGSNGKIGNFSPISDHDSHQNLSPLSNCSFTFSESNRAEAASPFSEISQDSRHSVATDPSVQKLVKNHDKNSLEIDDDTLIIQDSDLDYEFEETEDAPRDSDENGSSYKVTLLKKQALFSVTKKPYITGPYFAEVECDYKLSRVKLNICTKFVESSKTKMVYEGNIVVLSLKSNQLLEFRTSDLHIGTAVPKDDNEVTNKTMNCHENHQMFLVDSVTICGYAKANFSFILSESSSNCIKQGHILQLDDSKSLLKVSQNVMVSVLNSTFIPYFLGSCTFLSASIALLAF